MCVYLPRPSRGLPEPVAEVDALIVLGVLDVGGKRQALGIVRDHGGQILVDQVLETRAVAVQRNRSGGGVGVGGEVTGKRERRDDRE